MFGGTYCFHLYPEDGDSRYLHNNDKFLPDYMASDPRRQ
jgi:hypothetical protein